MDNKQKIEMIARRIAKDINDGDYVNLGIGMPTQVANYLPEHVQVFIQNENGLLGSGPAPELGLEDASLINAGGQPITEMPGCCHMDTALSFSIIRGGHLDKTILGALEVDQEGSIANWNIPGKKMVGMGGAMDLLCGAKKVVTALFHKDKNGASKIVQNCTLPLTAYKKVSTIVTDMAYIEVTENGLLLKEIASWTTLEDVIKSTDAKLEISDEIGVF